MRTRGGSWEGVKKSRNYCGRPKWKPPYPFLLQPEQGPQYEPDPVVDEEAEVAHVPQHRALPRVLLLALLEAFLRAERDEAAFRAGRDSRGRISESAIDSPHLTGWSIRVNIKIPS